MGIKLTLCCNKEGPKEWRYTEAHFELPAELWNNERICRCHPDVTSACRNLSKVDLVPLLHFHRVKSSEQLPGVWHSLSLQLMLTLCACFQFCSMSVQRPNSLQLWFSHTKNLRVGESKEKEARSCEHCRRKPSKFYGALGRKTPCQSLSEVAAASFPLAKYTLSSSFSANLSMLLSRRTEIILLVSYRAAKHGYTLCSRGLTVP